jgi:hypothetical protein
MATTARTAPAWTPADFFAHAAESCATALQSGLEAQTRAMDAWTKSFGAASPAMNAMAGFDTQARRFLSEAAEFSTKNVAEVAALSTESAKMTTALFADAVTTFFGPEAPASMEEALENSQRLARESVEMTRVLTDKSAKVAARQFETFQTVAMRASQPAATRKGAKDSR